MQALNKPNVVAIRPAVRPQRVMRLVVVNATTSNDIRNGMTIEIDGAPWRVTEFLHVKPGKGAAFVRTKLKNYMTGNTVEKTFRAGEPIELARVEKREVQFTYDEGENSVFMDTETYEELRVPNDDEWKRFLKEGLTVGVIMYNGACIGVEMPKSLELKITETEPGVKGNTASGNVTKPATVETGAVVQVPLFITTGEVIKINTETGDYIGRVTEKK